MHYSFIFIHNPLYNYKRSALISGQTRKIHSTEEVSIKLFSNA